MTCVDYKFMEKGDDYVVQVEATFDQEETNDGYLRFCIVISGSEYKLTDYCCDLTYASGIGHEGEDTLANFITLFSNSTGTVEEKAKKAVDLLFDLFFEDF